MACLTPNRRLETSTDRLLKRVHMCTERSFERTPVRHRTSKRKTVEFLSSTLSSGITLLSASDRTLVGDCTLTNSSFASLDRTLTESINRKVSWLHHTKLANQNIRFLNYFRATTMIQLSRHHGK